MFLPHPVNMLALGNAATDIIGEWVLAALLSCPGLDHCNLYNFCTQQAARYSMVQRMYFQSNTACNMSLQYVGKGFLWECRNLFKYVQMASQCSNRCWDVGPAAGLWHRTGGHGLRLTTRRIWTASQEVTRNDKRWQEMTWLQEPSETKKEESELLKIAKCCDSFHVIGSRWKHANRTKRRHWNLSPEINLPG